MNENEKDNGFMKTPSVCLGNPGYGKSPPTNEKARTKDDNEGIGTYRSDHPSVAKDVINADVEYYCINGHDKCNEMYPAPECPYCGHKTTISTKDVEAQS